MEKLPNNIGKVLDFVGPHKAKLNKLRRESLDVTQDGYLLYPESKVELDSAEAVAIAREIISSYDHPWSPNFGSVTIDFDRMKVVDFENQIGDDVSTQRLISLIEYHKNNPHHFAPEYKYAFAKKLLRRLDPHFETEEGS